MNKKQIQIDVSLFAKPLTEQLKGLCLPDAAILLEKDMDATARLRVRGYLSDSAYSSIQKKLKKEIQDKCKSFADQFNAFNEHTEQAH